MSLEPISEDSISWIKHERDSSIMPGLPLERPFLFFDDEGLNDVADLDVVVALNRET